jgi:CHAT domain-containing protein
VEAAVRKLRWDASAETSAADAPADLGPADPDAPMRFDRRTAFALYQQLVAPVEPVIRGKRRLFVVAGGALSGLPLSLLVTREPVGGADDDPSVLRDSPWFADDHALVHIPSLQSLLVLRGGSAPEPRSRRAGGFVGFGNPVLIGPPSTRSRRSGDAVTAPLPPAAPLPPGNDLLLADADALRTLARLPGTGEELSSLASLFPPGASQLFTLAGATEQAIRNADLTGAGVIAFATHGLMPTDRVGYGPDAPYANEVFRVSEPGLVTTPPDAPSAEDDGYLSASEVTTLKLDADWVILSACNSATPEAGGEPGMSALARAFFYAGARSLLASNWPVSDEVAPILVRRTVELERGRGRGRHVAGGGVPAGGA